MAQPKKPNFPSGKRFEEIRARLSNPKTLGSSLLPENATAVEKAKYKACEVIILFRQRHGLKQKELAERLGIDEPRMSEILHYKIESFTLDRLLGYAEKLIPGLRVRIDAA